MTNSTTEPNQSIRYRIARRLIDDSPTVFGYHQTHIDMFLPIIDAILAELQEPGKEAIEVGNTVTSDAGDIWEPSAGISYSGPECALECWQAMLQHIRDGGQ